MKASVIHTSFFCISIAFWGTTIDNRSRCAAAAAAWPAGGSAASWKQEQDKRGWKDRFSSILFGKNGDLRHSPSQNPATIKKRKSLATTEQSQQSSAVKVSLDQPAPVPKSRRIDQAEEEDKVNPLSTSVQEPDENGVNEGKEDSSPRRTHRTASPRDKQEVSTAALQMTVSSVSPRRLLSWSGIGMAFQQLFRRHGHAIRINSIRALQVGLGLYLLNQIVAALDTILEEELSGDSELYVKREDVEKLVHPNPKKHSSPPPQRAMDLAKKLVASGLPLTSETENSVERVMGSLTKTEANMLNQILFIPQPVSNRRMDIIESWNGIAGHAHIKEALLDILTLSSSSVKPTHAYSKLLGPPKGILLYGPPGCGKSMLISALAKTARARTLLVTPSTLLKKYVGESNLSVRTLFGLAKKLSPCIIVVEELDGLFRERSIEEHEVVREIKTEFLQLWDGILDSDQDNVFVVGATNRPFEVDSAVLRRMPVSFMVGLPCVHARFDLIRKLLDGIPSSEISQEEIAELTEYYSGSDLHQLLKTAVTIGPVRDMRRFGLTEDKLRPLERSDVMQALQQIRPTPMTLQYRQALSQFASQGQAQTHHQQASATPPETSGPTFYNMGTLHANVYSPSSSFIPPRVNREEELTPDDDSFWNTNDSGYEQDYEDNDNDDEDSDDAASSELDDFE